MSFGFGVGDIVGIVNLARSVYKKLFVDNRVTKYIWNLTKLGRDSPGQYRELAGDARQLADVLEDVGDLARERKLKKTKEQQLFGHAEACRDILYEIDALLKRYLSLGSKSRKAVDRLRWDQQECRDIRARLTTTITMLSTFYNTLNASGFVDLQRKLDELFADVRSGHRAADAVSQLSIEEAPSESDSWVEIVKELQELGVTNALAQKHRDFIIQEICQRVDSGHHDENNDHNENDNHDDNDDHNDNNDDNEEDELVNEVSAISIVKSEGEIHENQRFRLRMESDGQIYLLLGKGVFASNALLSRVVDDWHRLRYNGSSAMDLHLINAR